MVDSGPSPPIIPRVRMIEKGCTPGRAGFVEADRAYCSDVLRQTGKDTHLSQVAEPIPVAMAAAEFHEPQARQIEYCHGQYPHGIDEWQTVAVSQRLLRDVCDDRLVPDGLVEFDGNHDR